MSNQICRKIKFVTFALLVILSGCQEPSEVPSVMSIPTPNVMTTDGVNYIQTPKGNVYLAQNENIDLSSIAKATPAPPNFSFAESAVVSKEVNTVIFPTIKNGPINNNVGQKSVVVSEDAGGQFAYSIPNKSQDGIYANHTIYPDLNLNSAPNNDYFNVLYAPTTHAPNSCLEAGSNYWRGDGEKSPTYHYVRLYDFCNNVGWGTGITLQIDQTFIDNYVRNFDNKTAQYTMEIIGNKSTGWAFEIFNYKNNVWDKYYTSSPGVATYNGGEGWSLFETHYTIGPCSKVPLIESTDIQVLENGNWIPSEKNVSSWGNCFSDNDGNVSYNGQNNLDNWQVTSN